MRTFIHYAASVFILSLLSYQVLSYYLEQTWNDNSYRLNRTIVSVIKKQLSVQSAKRADIQEYLDGFVSNNYMHSLNIKINNEQYLFSSSNRIQNKNDFIIVENFQVNDYKVWLKLVFSDTQIRLKKQEFLTYGIPVGIILVILLSLLDSLGLFFQYRKPIKQLSTGIKKFSDGDYDFRIPLTWQDDVNLIIHDINQMAQIFQITEIEMQISNAKYRHLVENTSEIIFSMNDDAVLITINRAVSRHLGYRELDLKGKPFETILYFDRSRNDDMHLSFFYEKLNEIKETKSSQSFHLDLLHANGEVREMNVRLEYMQIDTLMVFWGKMEPVAESLTEKYCEYEHRKFSFGSHINIANLIVNAVSQNLQKYFDESDSMSIKIGIKEMIVNAIEHGNLNITYEEKTQATAQDNLLNLINERKELPQNKNKKITVLYSLNSRRVMYLVRDQGDGFDHEKVRDSFKVNLDQFHGRGIKISTACFDILKYNEKGNEVRMIKYVSKV